MKIQPTSFTLALLWFATGFSGSLHAAACDVDNDGDVDRLDLRMIVGARDTHSTGPDDARDADVDGTITMLDARACIRQCSLPDCNLTQPAAPAADKGAGRQNTADAYPIRHASREFAEPVTVAAGQPVSAIQGSAIAGGGRWQVKRGDTLYSIGRALFPRDSARQTRFRRDVMALNPSVFAKGANNMAVGAVLVLPEYAGPGGTAASSDRPAQVAPAAAETAARGRPPQPAEAGEPVAPALQKRGAPADTLKAAVTPESVDQAGDDPTADATQSTAPTAAAEANASISLGYSRGGDRLENTGDAGDLYAGSGAHLRLGFDHLFRRGSGYRVAFGLQYDLARDNGDNSTFRDAYLQLAYLRRSDALVYGIGVVLHTGATQKEETTREYEPAAGAQVYLENVGTGALSGWGFSYTSMEIEEQNADESIDASRAEIYYSWRL